MKKVGKNEQGKVYSAERGRITSCFISLHPLVSAIISQPSLTDLYAAVLAIKN